MFRKGFAESAYMMLLIAVLFTACGDNGIEEGGEVARRMPVRVTPVERERYTPQHKAFGSIAFLRKADVHPSTEGVVVAVFAEESDFVRSGALLARIDDTQLQISLDRARADLDSTRSQLNLANERLEEGMRQVEARFISMTSAVMERGERERALERAERDLEDKIRLFDAGGVTEDDVEDARDRMLSARAGVMRAENDLALQQIGFRDSDIVAAGYEVPELEEDRIAVLKELNTSTLRAQVEVAVSQVGSAETEVRRIQRLIAETRVEAPIGGIIGVRHSELGERITPDEPLFTIIDASQVYADIEVSENDLGHLAVGQAAEVSVPALGATIPGRVARIAPILAPTTRSGRVRVLIPEPDGRLRPGMFAEVAIETAEDEDAMFVPTSTVVQNDGGVSAVYVLRGERIFRADVALGDTVEHRTSVDGAVEAGDMIVLNPSSSLRDGTEVEVVQ